ncbi:MAG: (S)-benzoin forming benzil reductase [Crocinitomicaceae bacterium]
MRMYLVTGVSRGLGKATVEALLDQGQRVIGIGRSNPFGDAIEFITCDFGDAEAVASMSFDALEGDVTLINNAGIIGEIGRISELPSSSSDLEKVMQVNVFAPMALTKKVYASLSDDQKFRLVNISSGAANRSIPAWASYCASKAALNRLTENFYLEEQELGKDVTAYAVSPGVIDTGMQVEIRSADSASFSSKENFVKMKEEGALYSPEEAANRLLKLLSLPFDGDVFQDLRSV